MCLIGWSLTNPRAANAQFRFIFVYDNAFGPDGTPRAHVGDMITSRIGIISFDDFYDTFTINYASDAVHYGTGDVTSPNLLTEPLTVEPFADYFGCELEITNSYPACLGKGDYLSDHADVRGTCNFDGFGGSGFPGAFESIVGAEIKILQPGIQLAVECKGGGRGGSPVTFSGSVSNCGNTLLTNVLVSSYGNLAPVFGPINLEAGQRVTFNYVPVAGDGGSFIGCGTDELGLTVSNSVAIARMFLGLTRTRDGMTLDWNTIPERVYQVQYKANWEQENWTDLGSPILAVSTVANFPDSDALGSLRFYRVVLLPQPTMVIR